MPGSKSSAASARPPVLLDVSREEDGMKLLRFLERRLERETPKATLYKWIRTGQVRVNGGRARAGQALAGGDVVRLPPFAAVRAAARAGAGEGASRSLGPDIIIVAETADMLALAKPGGLACQPGTAQQDSLAQRLAAAYAGQAFIPAPAHRLDRHTSGLVLAGKTLTGQRRLHELFRQGAIGRWYLAWVAGDWAGAGPCLLRDSLATERDHAGRECTATRADAAFILPLAGGGAGPPQGGLPPAAPLGLKDALSAVMPVQTLPPDALPESLTTGRASANKAATLLLVRLFTGRKHQIRVQLASRGRPVIGDGRHGGPSFTRMLLHAYALRLPVEEGGADGETLALFAPPPWPEPFVPDAAALERARRQLEAALP